MTATRSLTLPLFSRSCGDVRTKTLSRPHVAEYGRWKQLPLEQLWSLYLLVLLFIAIPAPQAQRCSLESPVCFHLTYFLSRTRRALTSQLSFPGAPLRLQHPCLLARPTSCPRRHREGSPRPLEHHPSPIRLLLRSFATRFTPLAQLRPLCPPQARTRRARRLRRRDLRPQCRTGAREDAVRFNTPDSCQRTGH